MRFFCLVLIGLALSLASLASSPEEEGRPELSELLNGDNDSGFRKATEPRIFVFPRDHGPHTEYRNEWWYVTGNLDAADGRRFGFEVTIFRFALTSELAETESAWRTNQVFIAHFAITDVADRRFLVAEKFSRGAAGLAGAQAQPFRVWIDDWELADKEGHAGSEHWRLRAADDEFAIDLDLEALKGPVLNGIDGLSQKSSGPGNASYYYSMTRWQSSGSIRIGDDVYSVAGLSWLDREWSTSALGSDQQGWDWFALQLSDGSELMYYNLRKTDGTVDDYSAGTWIDPDGVTSHIPGGELILEVTGTWESPDGGVYPAAWTLRLEKLGLVLDVRPVMADQELITTVRYWEGAVDVEGSRGGTDVRGRGYVELTGYVN